MKLKRLTGLTQMSRCFYSPKLSFPQALRYQRRSWIAHANRYKPCRPWLSVRQLNQLQKHVFVPHSGFIPQLKQEAFSTSNLHRFA